MWYSQVNTELIIWVCCASGNVTTSPIPIVLIVDENLWWSHVVLDESIIKVVHDSHLNHRENEPADIVNLKKKSFCHCQSMLNAISTFSLIQSILARTHGRGEVVAKNARNLVIWGLVAIQSSSTSPIQLLDRSTPWPQIWKSRLEIPFLSKFANQVTSFKAQLVR